MNYNDQIKADRKAAALARRAERAAGLPTEIDERKALFPQTETMKTNVPASINRRYTGRIENLTALGMGFRDTHLAILGQLSAQFPDDQLKAMGLGQNAKLWKFDRIVAEHFGFEPVIQQGILDDPQADTDTPWMAWFYPANREVEVKEFIRNLIAA